MSTVHTANPDRWHITAGELDAATAHAEAGGAEIRINSRQAYKSTTVVSRPDAPGFWLLLALAGPDQYDRLHGHPDGERYEAMYLAREHAVDLLADLVGALAEASGEKPSTVLASMLEGALADESDAPPTNLSIDG